MKFSCEQESLAYVLSTVSRAVSTKPTALPVLSGIQITAKEGKLRCTGTDLDITIRSSIVANIEEEGEITVSSKLINEIVKAMPEGSISFSIEENILNISSHSSSFDVVTLKNDDFPKITFEEKSGVKVSGKKMFDSLARVLPCASKDESRPILTGIYLTTTDKGLRFVATDSYRLAYCDVDGIDILPDDISLLIPAKGLQELQKMTADEIEVTFLENIAIFKTDNSIIQIRLLEGEYPKYEQLIPSGYPNICHVEASTLSEAIRRVRLIIQGRDAVAIKMNLENDTLTLSANALDIGEAQESIEVDYSGETIEIAFNPEYLLEGINVVKSEVVTISTQDPLKPATLKSQEDEDFLYLLMPVRT